MSKTPPNIATRFLRWFCRTDRLEEVEGDLLELYEHRLSKGQQPARMRYFLDVLLSFNRANLKRPSTVFLGNTMMSSYLKIGCRNLTKDLRYSLINLLGLSLGLAVFIIMILLVNHEYSYDRFHNKGERIFEVVQVFHNADGEDPEIFTSLNLASALREEMPGIENAVTIHGAASTWIEANSKKYFEEEGIVASREFFEIFDFGLLSGNKSLVLANKHSIVIDQDMANKYFGTDNPIGQIINLEHYGDFTVTGIMDPVPANSFIRFNYVLTQDYDLYFEHVAAWFPDFFMSWQGTVAATYVLLENSEEAPLFNERIKPILAIHQDTTKAINDHFLINLYDLHFKSKGIDGSINRYIKGDERHVKMLMLIAFIILAMAAINYINLTTARSLRRVKEVGVRKSMGSLRYQIVSQYLIETFIQVLIAVGLAFVWVFLFLPYFISISGIKFELSAPVLYQILPVLIISILLVTILSGAYPAIYLSKFSPVKILRKSGIGSGGSSFLRNSLMIIQYGLVMVILSSFIIINDQYRYILSKDLGFDTDQLVVIEINGAGVRSNYPSIKQELLSHSEITQVAGLTRMIGGYRSSASVMVENVSDQQNNFPMRFYGMDEDAIATLDLKLISGSNFIGKPSLDSVSVFLNQRAAELYGGGQVLGKELMIFDDNNEHLYTARVIGIMQDFNYGSLHEPIGPVIIGYYNNRVESLDDIVIKLSKEDLLAGIDIIESVHNQYDENGVITLEFMDDMVQRSYEQELLFRNMLIGASIISMIIALMGIVGLISYNLNNQRKEFGIRKVLGAGYLQIFMLQSKQFISFIIIATVVTIPLVWMLANKWLTGYAFRVDLTLWPFIITSLLIISTTILLLLATLHKTLIRNPVDELRYE